MFVTKSDNSQEEFSLDKIKRGIESAYQGCSEESPEGLTDMLVSSLHTYEGIKTSEIRRQVEELLMTLNKKVAKCYISQFDKKDANIIVLKKKRDFIRDYIKASNAATGSKYDANANVEQKNIVTLSSELYKGDVISLNRYILKNKMASLYNKKLVEQFTYDVDNHFLYVHDESSLSPYCVAISIYPWLVNGLVCLGGTSKAPTDLKSFCGQLVNLIFSISSQFAGAVAVPEALIAMDYFIRKDYGDDYIDHLDKVVDLSAKQHNIEQVIENAFQQIVHSINQPAGNRGYQAAFTNFGYFDKPYFEGVFSDFRFPDGSKPVWETISWLQKKFMNWFNEERTKYVLTFPVETMALLTDGKNDFVDKEYADFTAEMWAKGHSFFLYTSDSPDSLSSCCRLRNSLKNEDDEHNKTTHQYSMGTASVATGSKKVMSINLPRLIQSAARQYLLDKKGATLAVGDKFGRISDEDKAELYKYIEESVKNMTGKVHKYLTSFNDIIKDYLKAHMLTVYDAGFIDMRKQYLTVGVNGITDAAEFFDITVGDNDEYKEFINLILETINKSNKADKTRDCMFNTEFVPGENLAVKNYNWDKKDGYWVSDKRNLYSSYFYNPEDTATDPITKLKLHGKDYVQYLDGGSACHINLSEHLSKEQYRQLMNVAAENGCNYFTFNVKNTLCNDCGYISKHTLDRCPRCGSTNIDYLTRIIGYLKKISSFSEPRQEEANRRYYA